MIVVKGMMEVYEAADIETPDKQFAYLSNFNRFQQAKNSGLVRDTYENYLKLLKYERKTLNRIAMADRLLCLAMSSYKFLIRREMDLEIK